LQVAQIRLLEAARDTGIAVTVVHDRGGTPARGGGRIENLVESAPDGAIRGVLRMTEQGEVVNQSYGLRPIAMRTLERTFSAVAAVPGSDDATVLRAEYRATTNRMLRVAVNSFMDSLYMVIEVMGELDADVLEAGKAS